MLRDRLVRKRDTTQKSYHCCFLMILKLQPPDDLVEHTLISGQVVQPQPAAGRRRRAEASVIVVAAGVAREPLWSPKGPHWRPAEVSACREKVLPLSSQL